MHVCYMLIFCQQCSTTEYASVCVCVCVCVCARARACVRVCVHSIRYKPILILFYRNLDCPGGMPVYSYVLIPKYLAQEL
jgi:hypothetical protein